MRWSALLFVFALVLSGCAGGTDDGTTTLPGTATTSTSSGPAGQGTIEVLLNRTTIDGPAPLRVEFTLDATFKNANGTAVARPASAVTVTYRQAEDANGTATGRGAQNGPTIARLPATFSLTFEEAGKYEVLATVRAAGYREGQAMLEILPRVAGGDDGGPGPIFFDGAEGDTSQWTLSAKVTYIDFEGIIPTVETPVDHPTGAWTITDAEAYEGSHSWHTGYADNYRGRIVSMTIPVPGSGGQLSFWYKGGAEANCCDGLFVYINDGEVLFSQGVLTGWTKFTAAVPAGDVVLEFRMDADASCSSESGSGVGCGEGWDAGGFYVDNIQVA